MSQELVEQEVPSESRCPVCGLPPTDESVAEHRLSDMGYLHDDVKLTCENDHSWSLGIPIGENDQDFGRDLVCPSCNESGSRLSEIKRRIKRAFEILVYGETRWKFVHRIRSEPNPDGSYELNLHLKCPHCYHFGAIRREPKGVGGLALVGYPPITGRVEDGEES